MRDLLKPEANPSSRDLGIKSVFWEERGEQKSVVCSKPRERLPKWCLPPSPGLAGGQKLWEHLLHPQMGRVLLLPPLLAVVPEELQATLLLPPSSVCPFGGVLSQPCLRWQRTGRGGACLSLGCTPSPMSGMVPRAVPAFLGGHGQVLPHSYTFATSVHPLLRGSW